MKPEWRVWWPWALWLLCGLPAWFRLVGVYEFNPDYSHGYLVPAIAGYAIWHNRAYLTSLPRTRHVWPLPLLLLGLGMLVLGQWYDIALQPAGLGVEFLMGIGLWISAVGLAWMQQGGRRLLAMAFPTAYLLFGIPIPESWTGIVTLPMRRVVTVVSAWILDILGFSVEAAGNVIYFEAFTLGIADACSGMRSLWSLVAACVAIGYLIDCRPRHLLALAVISIPLSFAQNILRVLLTAFAMQFIDPVYGEGWRHELMGWITFFFAALVAVWLANRWSLRSPNPSPAPLPDHARQPVTGTRVGVVVAGLLFAGGAMAQWVIRQHYYKPQSTVSAPADHFAALPEEIGPFQLVEREELDDKSALILNPSDSYMASWRDDRGHQLHVMVFRWDPQRLGVYGSTFRPHSPEICYPNAGWRMRESMGEALPMTPGSDAVGFQRVFVQGRIQRVVLFVKNPDPGDAFMQEFPSPGRARLEALVRSWEEADLTLGQQFSVSVAVDRQAGQTMEEVVAIGRRFMRFLAPSLEPYGIRYSVEGL